jgi:hypothetical protein
MKRALILALLVAFSAVGMASAQSLTGTIQGKVTDEQGGVLPGVTVTLTGRTGTQTQVTDGQGAYRFIGLTPGNYSIKAELQGFKTRDQQGIDVGISKTVDVPLGMTVGGLSETVDVVANAVMIDATTTATDTNMSQDLLFAMPIGYGNVATGIMNYSPGINSGSAFGGSSDSGNSLMLDGVDTRDPEGGTGWTFFNYNIVEEVQVGGLGQPAEYGGFTGAVVNSITKSGGNRFSFLADFKGTNNSLASSNIDQALVAKNLLLKYPAVTNLLADYTVQLGGPIKKDKVFFFLSGQRYQIKTQYSGSKVERAEVSPRFNMKFTFQPSANDNIIASLQYDSYNQKGRVGFLVPAAAATQSQTIDQDSPEYIWNGQYRKVFNSTTFLEVKWTGYWGYYDLNPVDPSPNHYDGAFDTYWGGAGYTAQYDRTRNQVNAAVTKYAELAGSHSFKFGVEIERSTIRDRFSYQGNAYFYDYGGAPSYAYGYSYDLKGKNKRESYYAQDQWKLSNVTLNLGLRLDSIRGDDTTTDKGIYSTFSVGPRAGFAWDITKKGSSVLKGYYGQLYDSAMFSTYSRAVAGLTPNFTYIPSADWKHLTVDSSTQRLYTMGDNIKHPRVDEINFAFEQLLSRDFKLTVTGIKRDWKNFMNSWNPKSTWTTVPYTNPLTNQPMTTYKWTNSSSVENMTITNNDLIQYNLNGSIVKPPDAYRSYRGLMLVLQRALRNRWQGQVSYVYSQTKGTIDNGTYSGIYSTQYENMNNAMINTDGESTYGRPHEFKLYLGYQIPKIEVSLDGYYRWMSGTVYTPYSRIRARNLGWPFGSYVQPNLVAPGVYRNDNFSQTDLRMEKVFKVGFNRIGVYLDLQNLFNQGIITARQTRYPSRNLVGPATPENPGGTPNVVAFGDPTIQQSARQFIFGLRWSF